MAALRERDGVREEAAETGLGAGMFPKTCPYTIDQLLDPDFLPYLPWAAGVPKQDDFSSNRHPALGYRWSMIFSENRCPLFGIML